MSNNVGRFLRKLRGLSHSWRWNFHPRVRQESVAEHSFWVAVIVDQLMKMKGAVPYISHDCVIAALYHDMEEAITGDLPSLVKRGRDWKAVELAAYNELTGDKATEVVLDPVVYKYVKMADTIAALLFADEEVRMGNTWFLQIRGELISTALSYGDMAINDLLFELGFTTQDARAPIVDMSHL